MPASLIHLKPTLQPFPYGREGTSSRAAQYALSANPSETKIESSQPYGELWIGSTHPNGLTTVFDSNEELREVIKQDPEWFLGPKVSAMEPYKNGLMLPYLLKVLSFDKALPLQAHPDRKTAKKLYEQDRKQGGDDFVDPNHKPECCVALTPFQAFIGFRPLHEVISLLTAFPSLAPIVTLLPRGEDESSRKQALKYAFNSLIKWQDVETLISAINEEVQARGDLAFGELGKRDGLAEVWQKNLKTYGKDVGMLITTLMMNFIKLNAGEGAWILADDIHAYIEGDCIECMANSDNMVAHGLGESVGGVKTFVDMLSYRDPPSSELLLIYEDKWPKGERGHTRLYKVPISEFDLLRVTLPASGDTERIKVEGPLELIVVEGDARLIVDNDHLDLGRGGSAFVAAGRPVGITAKTAGTIVWGAFVE